MIEFLLLCALRRPPTLWSPCWCSFSLFFLLWKLFFFMSEIISEFYCLSHLHKTRSTLEKVEEIKN